MPIWDRVKAIHEFCRNDYMKSILDKYTLHPNSQQIITLGNKAKYINESDDYFTGRTFMAYLVANSATKDAYYRGQINEFLVGAGLDAFSVMHYHLSNTSTMFTQEAVIKSYNDYVDEFYSQKDEIRHRELMIELGSILRSYTRIFSEKKYAIKMGRVDVNRISTIRFLSDDGSKTVKHRCDTHDNVGALNSLIRIHTYGSHYNSTHIANLTRWDMMDWYKVSVNKFSKYS